MPNIQKSSDTSIKNTDPLEKLKEVVLEFLGDEEVKIVLFGSRARRDFVNTSDVDVGIIIGQEVNRKKLIMLREYIEGLNIPYKVEIVDFSAVSEGFKQMALKEAIVWKD